VLRRYFHRECLSIAALAVSFLLPAAAYAFDESKYPDFSGQWERVGGTQWDPGKPRGVGQGAPLTPESRAKLEASIADQKAGGEGGDTVARCMPQGMPRIMTVIFPMEIVITPSTTHILFDYSLPRRIYTDGRDWPREAQPSFLGYSIGKWVDENGDGRYDALEVETRDFKGPRVFEDSGMPLHEDNATVIDERIYVDKANPDLLHDEITTTDHALTRPWTVMKNFRRVKNPIWFQNDCSEDNRHVRIDNQDYFLSADNLLMPAKKDQPPPDLRYFGKAAK